MQECLNFLYMISLAHFNYKLQAEYYSIFFLCIYDLNIKYSKMTLFIGSDRCSQLLSALWNYSVYQDIILENEHVALIRLINEIGSQEDNVLCVYFQITLNYTS